MLFSLFSPQKINNQQAKPEAQGTFPYGLRDEFLSPAELSFYKVLLHCVPDGHSVICKVRLGDIFYVKQPHQNRGARNKIQMKHVDFLICDSVVMQPKLAIELDDSTHNNAKTKERDAFVDQVYAAAELPVLHLKAERSYSTETLKTKISQALGLNESASEPPPLNSVS